MGPRLLVRALAMTLGAVALSVEGVDAVSVVELEEGSNTVSAARGGVAGLIKSGLSAPSFFGGGQGRRLYPDPDPYPYPTDPYPTDPYPSSDDFEDVLVQDMAFGMFFPGASCDDINYDELLAALIASWQFYGLSVDLDNTSITQVTCPDGSTFVPSEEPTLTRRILHEVLTARSRYLQESGNGTVVELLLVGLPEDEVAQLVLDLSSEDPDELATLFDLCTGCDTEGDPTATCTYAPGDGLFSCFNSNSTLPPSVEGPLQTSLVYDPINDGPSGGGPTVPINQTADVSGDPHITGFDGSKFDLFASASGAHVNLFDIPDAVSIQGTLSVAPEAGLGGDGLTMTYVDTLQATILGGSELQVRSDGTVTVNDRALPMASSVTVERGAATVAHTSKDVRIVDDLAGGGYKGEGCSSVGVRMRDGGVAFTVDVMRDSHLNLQVNWQEANAESQARTAPGGILGATAGDSVRAVPGV